MKSIAIIYSSKYGTTKKYATWIAEDLKADLFEKTKIKPNQIASYDIIIYGGGLYAGGISGIELVTKNLPKQLIVFTVGLANPNTTDYIDILAKNFDSALLSNIKVFHLRGGIDYKKLGIVHKCMMSMLKNFMLEKKTQNERTDEEQIMLEAYGNKVDFTDKSTIKPIVDYIRKLQTTNVSDI